MVASQYSVIPEDTGLDGLVSVLKQQKPRAILFPSTPSAKELAARLAVRENLGLCADCTGLETDGQQLIIDTGYLAMMDDTCKMDIQSVKGFKNVLFGGEGLFNTVVTGVSRSGGKIEELEISLPCTEDLSVLAQPVKIGGVTAPNAFAVIELP